MSKRLFVGSLSWGTTEEDLRAAFEEHGEVTDCRIITHRDGEHEGKSKGFGFVTFADDTEGANALRLMDGAEIDGRQIRVSEAHEQTRRNGGGGGPRRDGGGGNGGNGNGRKRRGGGGGGGSGGGSRRRGRDRDSDYDRW